MYNNRIYCRLTAIIFLAAFIAQTFSNTFIIADYYTDTARYVKDCENKDKPMMHCNGKCQMMKKLQKEEKKDQENPERKSENKNLITLSSKSFLPELPNVYYLQTEAINKSAFSNTKPVDRSFDIFHPPQV